MNALAGTPLLLRLALRRERVALPVWIALISMVVVGTLSRYLSYFPTRQVLNEFAATVGDNPVFLTFTGQVVATSYGGMTVWRTGDFAYLLTALMAVFTVIRHTRGDEEDGRAELLGAGVVGRLAPLTASLSTAAGAGVLIGALCALGLIALGQAPAGSLAFGLAIAGVGCISAAIAALAAQLAESARTASTIAGVVLAVAYLIRFVADGSGRFWLKWLSPLGWAHQVRAFGVERWWVLGLMLAAFLALAGVAYALAARRDLGAGVLPQRPGPAGSQRLTGPLSLAWRLQRGSLLLWAAGYAAMSIATISLTNNVPALVGSSEPVLEFFRRYSGDPQASISSIFIWLILLSLGITAALYAMLVTLRLRAEEAAGRAELLLSTAVSRSRWAWSYLTIALAGTLALMLVGGLAGSLVLSMSSGQPGTSLLTLLAGALIQVPAAWVMSGFTMLVFGVAPRLAPALAWSYFLLINLFGEVLGPAIGIDYWIADAISPFHYLPRIVSGGAFNALPVLALLCVTALLLGGGLLAFQRRDVG